MLQIYEQLEEIIMYSALKFGNFQTVILSFTAAKFASQRIYVYMAVTLKEYEHEMRPRKSIM